MLLVYIHTLCDFLAFQTISKWRCNSILANNTCLFSNSHFMCLMSALLVWFISFPCMYGIKHSLSPSALGVFLPPKWRCVTLKNEKAFYMLLYIGGIKKRGYIANVSPISKRSGNPEICDIALWPINFRAMSVNLCTHTILGRLIPSADCNRHWK